ncbi:MAG: serine acetyltransferase [Cytophagales bacterium]|nr:serine acetyltransferase [Cytophagales bacterium]
MMNQDFAAKIYKNHVESKWIPVKKDVINFLNEIFSFLFPQHCDRFYHSFRDFEYHLYDIERSLYVILETLYRNEHHKSKEIYQLFFAQIPNIYDQVIQDADAMVQGDPAAKDMSEVIATYPGFYAIAVYRIANFFHAQKVDYIPRLLTEIAHEKTGIDIHPGATIGSHICIDHGTGIVVGGTSVIGNHVKIYQGVTLGALSVDKNMAQTKRHPTIQDHVVIYSGATILGGDTVIGHHSVIGGNVWLVNSVPAHSKVYHSEEIILK